ncbi:MarR family transcriptional regulator [Kribbella sp. NPDC026611]|uniref:MarR family winged helix-turn-helix transcriptional regulator n=1 Tax=Kribbella sp. NPDC026611 TaxID=3154911 RepID=UPI0033C67E9D
MAEDFGQRVPYMMRMVSAALSQELEAELRPFGLTHAQLAALAQLGIEDPEALSGATLGRRAGVTAQSMSTAIASLLDRGLVVRAPNPEHGRRLDVRITDEGKALLARAQAATAVVDERNLAALSADEQLELRRMLRKMMNSLRLFLPSLPMTNSQGESEVEREVGRQRS